MKATLEVINRMRTDGVIGKYAIGGAVGATFYLEPSATLDIDVFVSFQTGAIPLVCAMAAGPFGFLFGLGLVAIIGVIIAIVHKKNLGSSLEI